MTDQLHKISCPYEPIGFGLANVHTTPGGETQINMAEPIKCTTCNRYFKLRTRVVIYGEALPELDGVAGVG